MKYVRTEDAVMRYVAGEWILVPIAGNVAQMNRLLTTNDVGATVWSRIKTPATVEQIGEGVCDAFDVDKHTAQRDAMAYLEKLEQSGLVDVVQS